MLESKFAYGYDVVQKDDGSFEVRLKALPNRVGVLKEAADGSVKFYLEINGQQSICHKIYVNSTDRTIGFPKVHFIELHGQTDAGDQVIETIKT
jgi:hypothetical protein